MSQSSDESFKGDAFSQSLIDKLRRHPKRIVFTDGADERVLRVAAEMVRLEVGIPVLLGKADEIHGLAASLGTDMRYIKVLEPATAADQPLFCEYLKRIERYRGVELANACEVVGQPHQFGAMMIQYGQADALVGGNASLPAAVFRPLLHLVKPLPDVPRVFSVAILNGGELPHFGNDGVLFLGDCGLNPDPSIEQLAAIAVETGKLARIYFGRRPRVVLLSHSTKGSAETKEARKMRGATELARQRVDPEEVEIDGELQADVALDPAAAEVKMPGSPLERAADVLVFPNLDAAHITLKMLQHVGGAQVYGQMILGLARPAAQVPRTVGLSSLLGTALAVGVEAIKYHELYPDGEV